jgi:glycosyltransferase involved in cell wall biosynthesis
MHGGAVSLAQEFLQQDEDPDMILATSMLDLTTFLALTRHRTHNIPVALYMHENQLTYPWSPQDRDVKKKRDRHYAFINYASALASDRVFFNSKYHRDSFLDALPGFLHRFPDKKGKENVKVIAEKSEVLPLGMDLKSLDAAQHAEKEKYQEPVILWNHRWEYDKRPEEFFETLFQLDESGVDFRLVVLGERNEMQPDIFDRAKERLSGHILRWGYTDETEDYAAWLWRADILPVTSVQDFFGGSVVEAMYCNCHPLLPNRLAYPEHLPESLKKELLYQQGELLPKLQAACSMVQALRSVDYQSLVKKYDWGEVVSRYDSRFLINQ